MAINRRRVALGIAGLGTVAASPRTTQTAPVPKMFSLLDALTETERADVLAGINRRDITGKLADLLAWVHNNEPGGVVDARAVRGRWRWSSNPFTELPICRARLLTGSVEVTKDFNRGAITIPSEFAWQMTDTRIAPSQRISALLTDASPAAALVQTHVQSVWCSGEVGQRWIKLRYASDASRLSVGAPIALMGLQPFPAITHRLASNLDPSATRFAIAEPAEAARTIGSSSVYLRIGSEILHGAVSPNGSTVAVSSRGALGTTPSAHNRGSTIQLMVSKVFIVQEIANGRVRLDQSLPFTFQSAIGRAGAYRSRLEGRFTIDGAFDRRRSDVVIYHGLATTLSAGFYASGDFQITNCPHGGFFQMGAMGAVVEGNAIRGCGRPDLDLGAAVWSFGGGRNNQVSFSELADGHLALAIDNKSYGVPFYGLVDGERGSTYRFGRVSNFEYSVEVSGASDNSVMIHDLGRGIASPGYDDGAASGQTRTPVRARGNRVHIANGDAGIRSRGIDAALNQTTTGSTPS